MNDNRLITKFYKNILIKFFLLIYGKPKYKKKFYSKDFKILQLSSKFYKKINYKIYIINNGRIYNDNLNNVSTIYNKSLVPGANLQKINGKLLEDNKNIVLNVGTPKFIKQINGTVLSLIQDASGSNYSHWLLDILPKIHIYQQKMSLKNIDYFLLPPIKYQFQMDTLKLMGIKKSKILEQNNFRNLTSNKLIVIQHPWYHKGLVHTEVSTLPPWIVKWLRKKFISKYKSKLKIEKIFIDRSDSQYNHCKIINNQEVIKNFNRLGFKVVQLSKLHFKKQIELFVNAKIIVAAHGAGLTNLCFSNPKTKVLEIRPFSHPDFFFNHLSKINKLEIKHFISKPIKNTKNGDIFVDIDKINEILFKLLKF